MGEEVFFCLIWHLDPIQIPHTCRSGPAGPLSTFILMVTIPTIGTRCAVRPGFTSVLCCRSSLRAFACRAILSAIASLAKVEVRRTTTDVFV